MNFYVNSKERTKKKSSKNSLAQDILKKIPDNQMTINLSKDSNSTIEFKDNKISKYEEEEDEINSDEYISSTMLDVDTNTYINTSKNIDNDYNKIENNKNYNLNSQKGRSIKNNKFNDLFLNNISSNINNNERHNPENIINNNNNSLNNKDIISKAHHYFKREFSKELNKKKQCQTVKGKKVISNSIDKNGIFTPNNEDKKAMKLLRGIILEKMIQNQNKNINDFEGYNNMNKSNTINLVENNIDKNKKKGRNIIYGNNENISIVSNNNNKNMNINNIKNRNIQNNNNNININIYNKNIIKDIGSINIDGKKYQLIPQLNKKLKTQGRIGKIKHNDKNNSNNIYMNNSLNNNNNILNHNKTSINNSIIPNSLIITKNNTSLNDRLHSPKNIINNNILYNSINHNKAKDEINVSSSKNGIRNLKNLKNDNLHKTIEKYLLENKYKTILPSSPCERKNIINMNINNDNKKQLRSVNSCYSKKINKFIFHNNNNYQAKPILSSISNDNSHNLKNYKNKELSYNTSQEYNNILKDAFSLKKKKNNKNKYVLQSCVFNIDYQIKKINNSIINKSYQMKQIKPRIKLDLTNESLVKNSINTTKNNSSIKRIIYITNNNNYRNINSKNSKDLYTNINNTLNNHGRNTYATNRINNNYKNNKAFYKKIQKDNINNNVNHNNNINDRRINNFTNSSTINYNTENNEHSRTRKIIYNSSNYNITNENNKEDRIKNKLNKKALGIMTDKSDNINHKRLYIYNPNNKQINNKIIREKKAKIETNINNKNNKIRHNHTLSSINNFNNLNKIISYRLNNQNEINQGIINNNKINNYNGNNFLYFSNDKERNTINNKSYGNLNLYKNNIDNNLRNKN